MLPSGVVCTLLCAEGKFAGWKRGRDGSFKELVLARRVLLPCRVWTLRGEGGCSVSYLGASYRGESGEVGLRAGDVRGEGILMDGRGLARGERTGERPLEGATVGRREGEGGCGGMVKTEVGRRRGVPEVEIVAFSRSALLCYADSANAAIGYTRWQG